ncbi:hypothetical protein CCR75_006104 [Bremia lactucae]|uniref:Uncharacterized protein n=1 Tax=Bremia lactucae TaxID=4779 RepID=A0A976NYG8_BRELC|nr:hypothetical protein CCR75_006104 [Bremia lactucae]
MTLPSCRGMRECELRVVDAEALDTHTHTTTTHFKTDWARWTSLKNVSCWISGVNVSESVGAGLVLISSSATASDVE